MIVSRYVVSHQELWRYEIETINGKNVMKLSTISHFEALTLKCEVFSTALNIDMIVIKNAPGWVSFDVMQTIRLKFSNYQNVLKVRLWSSDY